MKYITHFAVLSAFLCSCTEGKHMSVSAQPKALYDEVSAVDSTSINGFKDVVIFSDNMDNTVWVSPEKNCVSLSKEGAQTYAGPFALHVKWDKITGGCKWIGIGFGWNNWQAKDMIEVVDEAAVQFHVKAVRGSFSNLPVAFAFEDYTGVQTYYGFNSKLASGNFNDSAWTTVTIPLSNFPFTAKDADLGKVKQFIIQLEADGDIYLDEIKIVKLIK